MAATWSKSMSNKWLVLLPAITVPAIIPVMGWVNMSDAVSGMVVGILLGLSILGVIRTRRCPVPS